MNVAKRVLMLTPEQTEDLFWFLQNRKSDIELGMENFGALKSLLSLLEPPRNLV